MSIGCDRVMITMWSQNQTLPRLMWKWGVSNQCYLNTKQLCSRMVTGNIESPAPQAAVAINSCRTEDCLSCLIDIGYGSTAFWKLFSDMNLSYEEPPSGLTSDFGGGGCRRGLRLEAELGRKVSPTSGWPIRVYAFLLVQGELRRIGSYSSSHLVFKGRFSGHEMDVGPGFQALFYGRRHNFQEVNFNGLVLRFHCIGDLGVRPGRADLVLYQSRTCTDLLSVSCSFDRLNF